MSKRSPHARELHRRRYQPQTVPDKRRERLEELIEDEMIRELEEETADPTESDLEVPASEGSGATSDSQTIPKGPTDDRAQKAPTASKS